MVGWRRAFCTSIPREPNREQPLVNGGSNNNPSPRFGAKLAFFSSNSTPSTPRLHTEPTPSPRLRCRTMPAATAEPPVCSAGKLHCKTSKTSTTTKSPGFFSTPSSPRSPSTFSLLKSTLRLSKLQSSRCGICLQSVKTGQGMAIFTAECSHSFHFPCISTRFNKHSDLLCPVCGSHWKEVPFLSAAPISENPNFPRKKKVESTEKKDLKVYNDDEPLMSPTAGTRFNPIPESDENYEEEFQGFFVAAVAPAPSSAINSHKPVVSASLSSESVVVTAGRNSETHAVVLKIKAPTPPEAPSMLNPSRRAPIDLVAVVDVGGSSAKLQMIKRAMRLVISSLSSADRISIVAFSATSKRLLPLRRMTTTGRRSARRIIESLVSGHSGGDGSAGDAVKKAAKVLEDRREKNSAATIILLSEGSRSSSPVVSSTRLAHLDVPVHAVGLGDGGAWGYDAAAEDAFVKCVGGLLSVVVQDVRVQFGLGMGSDFAEIPAVYSCTGRPMVSGPELVRVGDLYAEEERELLVELRVPTSAVWSHHVVSVRCSYIDPPTQEVIYGKEQTLLVPRPHTVRSSSSSTVPPSIERLRNLFVYTRAVAESRRACERNDYGGAYRLLSSARALLAQQSAFGSAEEFICGLDSELADLQRRRQHQVQIQRAVPAERGVALIVDEKGEPLTPTSAWRAAERLAKVAMMRKSLNRVSDLHGFENARF